MKRGLLIAGLVGVVGVLGACASSGSKGSASAGMVNSKCPMVPDHPIDPSVTTTYKGQTVGFCCTGCMPDWNALNDAQRDALLKKAK